MKKFVLLALLLPAQIGNAAADPFKDYDRSWHKAPPIVSIATLAQLSKGMSRRQVRALLGAPHFAEGVMAKGWNYLIDIADKDSTIGRNCQLRIDFTKGNISQIRWEKAECAELIG